jgi:hypothetical protein
VSELLYTVFTIYINTNLVIFHPSAREWMKKNNKTVSNEHPPLALPSATGALSPPDAPLPPSPGAPSRLSTLKEDINDSVDVPAQQLLPFSGR